MKEGTLTATTDQGTRLNYIIYDDETVSLHLEDDAAKIGTQNYPFEQVRRIAKGGNYLWVELALIVDNYVSVITIDTN